MISPRSLEKLVRIRRQQQRLAEMELMRRTKALDSALLDCRQVQEQLEKQAARQVEALTRNPAVAWAIRDSLDGLRQQLDAATVRMTECRDQVQQARQTHTQSNIELESCEELQRKSQQSISSKRAARQTVEFHETILGQAFLSDGEESP